MPSIQFFLGFWVLASLGIVALNAIGIADHYRTMEQEHPEPEWRLPKWIKFCDFLAGAFLLMTMVFVVSGVLILLYIGVQLVFSTGELEGVLEALAGAVITILLGVASFFPAAHFLWETYGY